MIKRISIFSLVGFLVLAAIVLFNTFTNTSTQIKVEAIPAPEVKPEALQHFQQAIGFKTISFGDSSLFDSTQFIGFRNFLENTYPQMHQTLTKEIVVGYSLLYKWVGKDSSLKPVVIMAHQDVVQACPSRLPYWVLQKKVISP